MSTPPLALILLNLWAVAGTVLVVAQPRSHRSFLIHLGRESTLRDRAWGRIVQGLATGCAVLCTFAVLIGVEPLDGAIVVGTIVPVVGLSMGLARAFFIKELSPPSGHYAVAIDPEGSGLWDIISPVWHILHISIAVAATMCFSLLYPHLPDQIPMQFKANGTPSRYGAPDELWLMSGLILFNIALMWLIAFGFSRERLALAPGQETRHLELQLARRCLSTRMSEAILTLASAAIAVLWIAVAIAGMPNPPVSSSPLFWLGGLLVLAAVVGPLAWAMPQLAKVQDALREIGGSEVLGTQASGWKAGGLIYYAPDDPALFVPKALGIGQTLNFARPAAWLLLGLLLGVPLLMVAVATLTS